MQMQEDIEYATLNVLRTQPEQVYVHTISNPAYFSHNNFEVRLLTAFSDGWDFCCGLFLALLSVWPLWLLLAGGILVWCAMRRKRMPKTTQH